MSHRLAYHLHSPRAALCSPLRRIIYKIAWFPRPKLAAKLSATPPTTARDRQDVSDVLESTSSQTARDRVRNPRRASTAADPMWRTIATARRTEKRPGNVTCRSGRRHRQQGSSKGLLNPVGQPDVLNRDRRRSSHPTSSHQHRQ